MKRQTNTVRNTWDMICPKCNTDDNLDVQIHALARLTANGTDIDAACDGSHEWDSNSRITCASCGWAGTVKDTETASKSLNDAPKMGAVLETERVRVLNGNRC